MPRQPKLTPLDHKPRWTNGRQSVLPRIDGELIYPKASGGFDTPKQSCLRPGAHDYQALPSLVAGQRVPYKPGM